MNPKTATPADTGLYKRVNDYYQDDFTEEKGTNEQCSHGDLQHYNLNKASQSLFSRRDQTTKITHVYHNRQLLDRMHCPALAFHMKGMAKVLNHKGKMIWLLKIELG